LKDELEDLKEQVKTFSVRDRSSLDHFSTQQHVDELTAELAKRTQELDDQQNRIKELIEQWEENSKVIENYITSSFV
jgi:hypothetical protein